MEVLYPRCSGIDVHKRFLVACLSIVQTNGQRHKDLRQFSTMTNEILALKEWLKASGCRQIAMGLLRNLADQLCGIGKD